MHFRPSPTRLIGVLFLSSAIAACSQSTPSASGPAASESSVATLEKPQPMSDTVSAREDFYQHVNGPWLEATSIPDDQSASGTIPELQARTRMQLKALIERLGSHPADRNAQKIVALYTSFMDEARIEAAGLGPIMSEWNRIEALTDTRQIPAPHRPFKSNRRGRAVRGIDPSGCAELHAIHRGHSARRTRAPGSRLLREQRPSDGRHPRALRSPYPKDDGLGGWV